MGTHPAQLLTLLLLGLIALGILAFALYLLYKAHQTRIVRVRFADPGAGATTAVRADVTQREPHPRKKLMIAAALAMTAWVFAGHYLVAVFYPHGDVAAAPVAARAKVRGASGADLNVTTFGAADAPTLVLTHGWGADSSEWQYAVNDLAKSHRVIVWDLPGLGASSPIPGNDYSLAKLAADLDSVVASAKGRPVVLVGHSIGGMINLEYARRFPQRLGREVHGIAQVNTTYTNPLATKKRAEMSLKLQKPVFEPLLHVVEWTSPVARALGWLAYSSGLAHMQLAEQSFAGAQTWEQLDHVASYAYRSSPAVVARGLLAMINWDGSDAMARINVPTLIISGDEDVTTLPVASDRMAKEIRTATRISVSPAAHFGPVEQHERYASSIGSFVASSSKASDVALK